MEQDLAVTECGLEIVVGPHGVCFSGGQVQRGYRAYAAARRGFAGHLFKSY
jgi:hypothetical protein